MIRYLSAFLGSLIVAFSVVVLMRWTTGAERLPSDSRALGRSIPSTEKATGLSTNIPSLALSPRRSVQPPAEVPVEGGSLCEMSLAGLSPELLAQTQARDENGFAKFFKENKDGFNSLRNTLLPRLMEKIARARDCALYGGLDSAVKVALAVNIRAEASRASIDSVNIHGLSASNDRSKVIAQSCLDRALFSQLPIEINSAQSEGQFAAYDGPYPRYIEFHLADNMDLWTGRPVAAATVAR
jgi:hypothetical protein